MKATLTITATSLQGLFDGVTSARQFMAFEPVALSATGDVDLRDDLSDTDILALGRLPGIEVQLTSKERTDAANASAEAANASQH